MQLAYHVTLWGVEDDLGPESQIVAKMHEVGSRAASVPFRVAFDHAADFGDRRHNPAFALAMSERLSAAEALQSVLTGGMRRLGRQDRRSFKPHLTLFYHRRPVAPIGIECIGWTAKELLLIRSVDGCSYACLGRWAFDAH